MSRVAVVTGAARGVGAATVRALAADGWDVIAVDRGRDDPRIPYGLGSEPELRALAAEARGVITSARVAVPALLRRPEPRDGRFIAVASAAATRGLPMLAVYTAAKAGVVGLVKAMAAGLRGTGVTANAVSPGSTRTAMLDESALLYALDSAEAFAAQQPLGRLLHPHEVAAMIAWLAGPEASGVTGAALAVDGGLSV